jgi:hypothetical protein
MKKILASLFVLVLIFMQTTHAQQISIGAAGTSETFNDLKIDPNDGGTIYVGTVANAGVTDCYLVKLNASRQVVWQRTIQNPGNDVLYRVRVCANGDYIAAGSYFQNGFGRGFLCRVNAANGNIIWATSTAPMASANGDVFYELIEMANLNIAVVGIQNVTPGGANGIVAMYTPAGAEIIKRISSYNNSDEFQTIAQLPNGNLVICGHYWVGNYEAVVMELNPATLNVNPAGQFNYRINLNIPAVNTNINTFWPSRSYLVNNSVMIDLVGVTGAGFGNGVQFVYNYTPVTGGLAGRYFYHNNGSGGFTTYPFTANDYIITQSNGNSQYVSRITNGATVFNRRIGNNTANNIGGSDANNGNLVLGGNTPGNDAYAMFSNINFPLIAAPCSVVDSNNLVNVANTPTPVALTAGNTFALNVNATLSAPVVMAPVIPNNPVVSLCGPPCPIDSSYTITKCSNASVTLTARPGTTYLWTPSTGLSSTTTQSTVCNATVSTTYTVTITNAATNCTYRDVVTVNVINCCPRDTAVNVTKCDIEDVVLTARPGTSYLWSPATGLSSTTIQNPICSATLNTVYTVTITNAVTNCTYKDVFNVTVNDCTCEDSCNWSLTGNSFVKPYNFIGSLNNADFKIRTNNTQRMVITAAGNVGINTPAPAKMLDVNGEVRIGILPAANPNERILFANALGDVHALSTTGNTNQYLSGNGTWQNLSTGGGINNADQGLTLNGNTVLLGDRCSAGGGRFAENREINMNDFDLYFNSGKLGKLYMGRTDNSTVECRQLFTRLEISSEGLDARNDYSSPAPSTSGLRFTNLTASDEPIANETSGVLSLDKNGDVIWVKTCCTSGLAEPQLNAILERLTKLENEVKESKTQAAQLRAQLTQMDVVLSKTNTIVLNQNVPNPFAESTVITYSIPRSFNSAQLVFSTIKGEVIKTIDIKSPGKGQINVFASDISSGLYMYTLMVDGRQIDSKKMVKQ